MEYNVNYTHFQLILQRTVDSSLTGLYTDRLNVAHMTPPASFTTANLTAKVVCGEYSITTLTIILRDLRDRGEIDFTYSNPRLAANHHVDLRSIRNDANVVDNYVVFGRPAGTPVPQVVTRAPLWLCILCAVTGLLCARFLFALYTSHIQQIEKLFGFSHSRELADLFILLKQLLKVENYDLLVLAWRLGPLEIELPIEFYYDLVLDELYILFVGVSIGALVKMFYPSTGHAPRYGDGRELPNGWKPIQWYAFATALNSVEIAYARYHGYTHYFELALNRAERDILIREYNNWLISDPAFGTVARGVQNHAVTSHHPTWLRVDIANYIVQYIQMQRYERHHTFGRVTNADAEVDWN